MARYKLSEIWVIYSWWTPSTKDDTFWNWNIPWITPKDLSNYNRKYISKWERNITEDWLNKSSATLIPKGSILMSSRAPIWYVAIAENDITTNQWFKSINCNENICLNHYMYYWIKYNTDYIKSKANWSTFKEISWTSFWNLEIDLPTIDEQKRLVKLLESIDNKIELNNQINHNLQKEIDMVYDKIFWNIDEYKRADEIADITIWKTPPRLEKECFSTNESDVKWISISDLNNISTYIYNTNERLTKDAINKYNVKVIPINTLILSFKLTVWRIAITTEDMTSNEAIAHFNLKNKDALFFLYCYLKNYDFKSLWSTSSIANAVNSKIIKSMMIWVPTDEKIILFNKNVRSLFEKININNKENETLWNMRDTLLPKLMNWEINLDKVTI